MLVAGAVLIVVGPIVGLLTGSFALIPVALDFGDHTAELDPTGTVTLDGGESVYLLAPVSDLEWADHTDCTARTADGVNAAVEFAPASELNTMADGARYESFAHVKATEAGDYTLECANEITVITAPPFPFEFFFGVLTGWVGVGTLASLVGIVLTIIGIVHLVRRRSA